MDAYALQRSWDQVTKHGDQVPLYFYSHIFVSHPEVRSMFPLSMSNQPDKFVSALGRIVSHADQLENDAAFLQHLGRDHRKYAVVAEHYNAVGASLCATLMHFLGSEWDEELAAHWTAAYQVVARIMVEAAETSSESSPDWWDADVVSAERRTMDLTLLTVRPRRAFQFLPGQSVSMEIPQRPRLWRYFSPANAPRPDGSIDLHVQQIDGGQVSPTVVRSLKAGDTVKLGAPVGERLTLREGDARDLLMVAGGTGLAPLLAVLEQIDHEWQRSGTGPVVHLRDETFQRRMRGLDAGKVYGYLDLLADQVQATERELSESRARNERLQAELQRGRAELQRVQAELDQYEQAGARVNEQVVQMFSQAQLVVEEMVQDVSRDARERIGQARAHERRIVAEAMDTAGQQVRSYAQTAQAQMQSIVNSFATEVDQLGSTPLSGESGSAAPHQNDPLFDNSSDWQTRFRNGSGPESPGSD